MKSIEHWSLLDGKKVLDNAIPELQDLKKLIPEVLHGRFDTVINNFIGTLAECDVHKDYVEKGQ
jgi:hypothetical protein